MLSDAAEESSSAPSNQERLSFHILPGLTLTSMCNLLSDAAGLSEFESWCGSFKQLNMEFMQIISQLKLRSEWEWDKGLPGCDGTPVHLVFLRLFPRRGTGAGNGVDCLLFLELERVGAMLDWVGIFKL
jgi:hypothetical protein